MTASTVSGLVLHALRTALAARPGRSLPALRSGRRPRHRVRSRARRAARSRAARSCRARATSGATASCCPFPDGAPRPPAPAGWTPIAVRRTPGPVGRRARAVPEGRGAQPHRLVQGPRERDRRGAGGGAARARRGLRVHRQRGLLPGRCRRRPRPARGHLRARVRARAEGRAAPHLRGARHPRARHLRRDLGAVPARLRHLRLVQPQRGREPVAGRGQEDVRPRDRRADGRARSRTGWRCRWGTAARWPAPGRDCARCTRSGSSARLPRMLGVQAQGARPLVDAFQHGRRRRARGRADPRRQHLRRPPPQLAQGAARGARVGRGASWPSPTTRSSRPCARRDGVPASSASRRAWPASPVCARPAAEGLVGRRQTALAVVTGSGLKDVRTAIRAAGAPVDLPPDDAALADHLAERPV